MRLPFWKKFSDVKNEGDGGGSFAAGYDGTPIPEPTEPKAVPEPSSAPKAASSQGAGDQFDEFGYAKSPDATGKPTEAGKTDDKSKPAAPAEPTEEQPLSTGYDKPVEDVPAPEPEQPKPAEIELGYDVDVKDLPAEDQTKLKEFLKAGSFSKEQAEKIATHLKTQHAESVRATQEAQTREKQEIARIKQSWQTELKNDKDFGGEHFNRNLKKVERVLSEFMPNTKNNLTKNNSMLPPSTMRDLLILGNKLFETESFEQGNPPSPEERPRTEDDDIRDMYK